MDEFGVLTERYGLKPQGKSAPMAASKQSAVPTSNGSARNFGVNSARPTSYNLNSHSAGFPDDIFFQSNANKSASGFGDEVFGQFQNSSTKSSNGSSVDYDSIFNLSGKSSSKSYANDDDDIFGLKSSRNDDVFGSFTPTPKQNGSVDDLLGGEFGGGESRSKNSTQNAGGFDDLLPGFGASCSPANGRNVEATETTFISAEDPFGVFETTSTTAHSSSGSFADPLDELGKLTQSGGRRPSVSSKDSPILKPPPKGAQVSKADKVKNSDVSSIDELEDFAMGRVRSSDGSSGLRHPKANKERQSEKINKHKEAEDAKLKTPLKVDDLESFFSGGPRSSSVPKSRAKTSDPVFDAKVDRRGPDVGLRRPSGSSSNLKKVSSATNIVGDLSAIFGGASVFGEFEEYEGESEERRRARLGRHQRTNDRVAKAVADMNQRDFLTQREREERSRIADALDADIKRWVAGKEGNLRALLSSLQYVLWPESGWQPVSLTDLITSSSVKKVYRKATLCVHPDKVQQKGATVQQKFIAEKVFDILKEAWNKFNKEELS